MKKLLMVLAIALISAAPVYANCGVCGGAPKAGDVAACPAGCICESCVAHALEAGHVDTAAGESVPVTAENVKEVLAAQAAK